MSDIRKIDKNFSIETNIDKSDIKFYSADEDVFKIYGVFRENEKYRRLPESVAKTVSDGVYAIHAHTTGGRLRFVTDSSYIAINAKMGSLHKLSFFAYTGTMGFDLYADGEHVKAFAPPCDITEGYESVIELGSKKLRDITVYFPLYSEVHQLYIGLQNDAVIEKAKPYANKKPIVYYGSSITQGGCATRAGMNYEAIISRRFNYDYINLGFAGNAKAEDEIADYIKNLDMSLFVYDYDHNAPTVEHYKKTHERMYQKIRSKNPDIPIIMMSRPKIKLNEEEEKRVSIIKNTYNNAVLAGDRKLYFISGKALLRYCGTEGTVDGCHPTDFGFASMAKVIGDIMEDIDII